MNTQNTPNNLNNNSDDDDNDLDWQVYSNAVVQGHHQDTGRTVYEEGVVHILPIIFSKLNLMPCQIVPITARCTHIELILKCAIFNNLSFGVCYKLYENKRTFGTIAMVVGIGNYQSFEIKALGRQRFEIVKVKQFRESHGQSLALAKIKIIPDIKLTHPYNTLCLHPKKHNTSHGEMCRKRDMWQTQWPDWVYKQFDICELSSRLSKKIKMLLNDNAKIACKHQLKDVNGIQGNLIIHKDIEISSDPFLLSFQVVYIGIFLGLFSQEQVNELLGIESTNLRLQYELQYWNKTKIVEKILCARSGCNARVCNMSNVFPMSPEGPQSTYCNSWGVIHEMITVTELEDDLDVISVGSPSTECCWFPGYKWTIILCPNCQSHLGWSYLADEHLTLTPRVFYGLSVLAITSIKTS